MKTTLLYLLPALASATAIAKRDGGDDSGPFDKLRAMVKTEGRAAVINKVPKATFANSKVVESKVRPGAKRVIYRYGPYKLAGKNEARPANQWTSSMDPTGQAFMEILTTGLCQNCTILTGSISIEAVNGSSAPQGVYLHHAVSFAVDKPSNLPIAKCEKEDKSAQLLGAEFIAQGDDSMGVSVRFTSMDGTFNSGFHMGEAPRILQQVDLVNYNEKSSEVYVVYELEYMEGLQGMDAAATLMSVTDCKEDDDEMDMGNSTMSHGGHGGHSDGGHGSGGKEIALDPNGAATTESLEFKFTKPGKLVAAFGHMHAGGENVNLAFNGKEVCSSTAAYGGNGGAFITSMSSCPSGIDFKAGDVFKLTAVYDLSKHPLREGGEHNAHTGMPDVMGMMYMTIATESQTTGAASSNSTSMMGMDMMGMTKEECDSHHSKDSHHSRGATRKSVPLV